MHTGRHWGPTVLVVAFAAGLWGVSANAVRWHVSAGAAWTTATSTSDNRRMRLEVQCRGERLGEPRVRLMHPVLDEVQAQVTDRRPHWHGVVRLTGGWGLDLDRSEHQGSTTYWRRCADVPSCLEARDAPWIVRQLEHNWTWHLRAQPRGRTHVDVRFDLAGSRAAIAEACRT